MLHKFTPSTLNTTLCASCKHTEPDHKCEACGNEGSVELRYGTMLMCPACCEKEDKLQIENSRPEVVASRLTTVIQNARDIDNSIETRSDIFNAKTAAIIEVETAINNNPEITNKPAALAEFMHNRFNTLKSVIHEHSEAIVNANNEQKAIQVYMNNLANQLKAEERAKYRIEDINYRPTVVKVAKPPSIKTAKVKIDKAELRQAAIDTGMETFTIQMVCIQKNITVAAFVEMVKKSLSEVK